MICDPKDFKCILFEILLSITKQFGFMSRGEWFLKFQMKVTKLLASKKEKTKPAEKQPSEHRGSRSSQTLTALPGKSLPV